MSPDPERVITLEIAATGNPTILRQIVERAADRLMEALLAAPDVADPSIALTDVGPVKP